MSLRTDEQETAMIAILTRVLPATDTLGTRLVAECDTARGSDRLVEPWDQADSAAGNHARIARHIARNAGLMIPSRNGAAAPLPGGGKWVHLTTPRS